MQVVRYDRSEWPPTAEMTPEGFLRADSVLTRTGVFKYLNPDGSMRRELRHPEDVFHADSMASFRLLPVVNNHPPGRSSDGLQLIDARNAKHLSIGYTGETVRADGPLMRCPVVIVDAQGVAAVKQGRRFLSCGYVAELENVSGTYDGEPYDFRQRNIRGNHVAIVDSPRAGEVAQIRLDGNQVWEEGELHMDQQKKLAAVVLDGLSYEAAPEVANALSKAQAELATSRAKFETDEKMHKDEIDRLRADRDSLKERLDKAEARDWKAEIAAAAKARTALEVTARQVLPEAEHAKLDGMTDAEIKLAVILARFPDAKLDGKSDVYIEARYDAAIESLSSKDDGKRDSLASQRLAAAPRQDGSTPIDMIAKSTADRLAHQWDPAWKPAA